MKVFEFIEKIIVFHGLLIRENTGTADILAQKLNVSRATVYNIIDHLKSYGIEIEYSRMRETFHYKFPAKVRITIIIRQDE